MSPLKGSVTHTPCFEEGVSGGGRGLRESMWIHVDIYEGCSQEEAGGAVFPPAFGRGLASHMPSRAGPGLVFIGGSDTLHCRTFRIVFPMGLRAVRKMGSISAVRIKLCSSTEQNWYLQIRSYFVFHFLSCNSSWLLFPCESTFILKLLPWAEVLWKIRLQFFFTLHKLRERDRERGKVCVSVCVWMCVSVCVRWGRGMLEETMNAAFERPLRIGLLGCPGVVSGDQRKQRGWLSKTILGC